MNRTLVSLLVLFILIGDHVSANVYDIGHPMKHIWFRPNLRLRPVIAELDNDIGTTTTTPTTMIKRKILVKHAFFRGDPREFLG